MHDDQRPLDTIGRLDTADKREWTAPAIRRFRAGDAENGIVAVVSDGQFSFRS